MKQTGNKVEHAQGLDATWGGTEVDNSLNAIIRRHLPETLRFGTVGFIALGVHICLFIFCIEVLGIAPIWANFIAFSFAFIAGFTGHFSWTFRINAREQRARWMPPMLRYLITSLVGLGLNTLVVYTVVTALSLDYLYAVVIMASIVPAIVYLLSKFWAFA